MTRYSRSVIPGRQGDTTSLAAEMDNLAFGRKNAANDEDDAFESVGEDEAIDFVERAASDRRAKGNDRRKSGRRRVSDFAPLPGEAAHRNAGGGSTRGMLILGGALAVVAVFGVVVWNAYREGVRPEDSAAAPVIEESGAFKSKPEATAKAAKEEATVFDQVESRPNVAPAPEEREVAPPTPKAEAKPAAPAPKAETKAPETKAAEVKPTLAPVQPVAAAPTPGKSANTVGTARPADLPVVGGTSQPKAATKTAEAKPTPAKPAAAKPEATVAPAAEPALAGAAKAAFTPAFSSGGRYAVQIAAPGTEEGALAEWKKAAKRAPNLFAKAEQIVQQAEVNGRTVFRVRAGDFGTPADAEAFCDAFKAAGGQCFRVTK